MSVLVCVVVDKTLPVESFNSIVTVCESALPDLPSQLPG